MLKRQPERGIRQQFMKPDLEVINPSIGAVERPATNNQSLTIEQVFQAVIEKQLSPENIEVMKQLLAMSAEQKFAAAFVELQKDLPVIVATSEIPNRGKYERFEDVMKAIQPALTKHGFTVSFSQDFKENRIVTTCHLKLGTHTESNSFAVRAGGKSDSDTQADCKASTTAKRNALLQALNIVIRQDCLMDENRDASLLGDINKKITKQQADELEHRLAMVNGNVKGFLGTVGADSFSNIPAHLYAIADRLLRAKEGRHQ